MLVYPEIDPIAIQFGPVSIAWYGIMYLLGFIVAYNLAKIRVQQDWSPLSKKHIDDLIFYSVIGVILGGRFGYMLFYDSVHLISDPLSWLIALPQLWNGGMSFHGGLLGVLCALFIISKRTHQPFISVIDFLSRDLFKFMYSIYLFLILDAYFLFILGSPISRPSLPLTSFGK